MLTSTDTNTTPCSVFPQAFSTLQLDDKPAAEPLAKAAILCAICGSEGFDRERLGVTWNLAWFSKGVIGSFRPAHVPARYPEERDTTWFSCVDPKKVSWISLIELRASPDAFLDTLRLSNVRVTPAAIEDLARVLDADSCQIRSRIEEPR